jgi:hypothetical protein
MEVSEVRRRLRAAIEAGRATAAERRIRSDEAAREYEAFLAEHAVPTFHTFAAAITGEGHPFKVFTPAGTVRLASERSADEFMELSLDTSTDPPEVLARVSRGRGRRMITTERPLRENTRIGVLTGEDVLEFLLQEAPAFLQR